MALHVQRQVVTTGEAALADLTAEGLGARVLAEMTRELVGAREPPVAVREGARVRLLACVQPLVRLEVGRLGVSLAAAGELAEVDAAFFKFRVVLPVVLDGGAAGVRDGLLAGLVGAVPGRGEGHAGQRVLGRG